MNQIEDCCNCKFGRLSRQSYPCNACNKWEETINDSSMWESKNNSKPKTGTTEEAKHYMTSKQPIEVMQELMTPEQFQGFLWGNVIKYSMRLNRKGKNREDAGKCWQYAKWMCDAMDGVTIVPGGK
jgi:hypothetical protein